MNFKIPVILFLSLSFFTCIAQKEVASLKIDDNTSMLPKQKEGYTIFNAKNGDLVIVMIEKKRGYASLLDKNFKEKSTLDFDILASKYGNVLGYDIDGETYKILFSNKSKGKFAILTIDFNSKGVIKNELDFDFDDYDEKYLEAVQYNNQLFLFSATKSNAFIIRELTGNGFNELKSFQIENLKQSFLKIAGLKPLSTDQVPNEPRKQKLLKREDLFSSLKSNVTKIDNRVPHSIEQTASNNKLYQKDNLVYLTIEDDENLQTVFYKIDLEVLNMEKALYDYPKGKVGDFKKYNSIILEDKIFQLGSSNNEMKIVIKNFEGETFKVFYIEVNQPISFKNSPIIQDGETFVPFVNHREMEETSKYLRKVSSGNIGLTGYKDGDLYNFSIGGFIELKGGAGGMMMNGGGVYNGGVSTGGVPVMNYYTYNPIYNSFYSYNATKSTFFNTHFDSDFNYVTKEESDNIFDRIKEFKKGIQYESAEDVFIHEGKVYFSYYNLKEKILKIIEM